MTAQISIQDVHKNFGSKHVLAGITLEIKKGDSVVIIGGSGTGKSVTLKCVLGLLTPEQGKIEIDGNNILRMTASQREKINDHIGVMFQGAALFDSMPVWENVAFGLLAKNKLSREAARTLALDKLALVGLGEKICDLSPTDLSFGMQKRVGLARAIASDPSIVFFDEPTTGLDPIMADVINDLILAVNDKIGATAITITHDMQSARKIGNTIAMLHQGKISWTGPVSDVDNSGSKVLDQFINGRTEGPIKMALRA
ncbi:MAG: ABC transporter ATP-binding protein [Rhodospirillaceae bacterium TMED8]|nr:ABC transporter ATP-binding protein [Magnetovibrio sp.]OUT50828.1 MAG: ABC transporter ATP-binding protein [Rhodospirillaceae bacterium TMED8]|tara:strand:+ start:85 stop:852 length:768 start_codon:yes stop_codon:yes gene_type:complete